MQLNMHLDHYAVTNITVAPNTPGGDPELIVLTITEGDERHRIVLNGRHHWQQVADQLAALGIVATPAESTIETYKCEHCGAGFAIAGVSSGSDDDLAADEYFDEEVRRHESGECVAAEGVGMTPRQPRFEVVRTDAGFHARFRAANGRIVWTTEVYKRRGKAVNAVELIAGYPLYISLFAEWPEALYAGEHIEVRDADERQAVSP